MFIDKAGVTIRGGDGGNGVVSFRHEKFVDRGGPDGGDGGDGGDVIVVGSSNENTLANFRFHQELTAKPGQAGSKRKRHGKRGVDLEFKVPLGTVVIDAATEKILVDITEEGQRHIVAKGGKGGFGNAHFVSSRRQAPRIAEKGEPGEVFKVVLELKIVAEVGLIGLPNAGKSTLLSRVSNAKPEIADYPFTTLVPNLGVADVGDDSLLIADIPGLIEGASKGKGLGDEFLRHVERTKVLVHVVDAYQEDLAETYRLIRGELKDYKIDLSTRPEIIALNKIDGLDEEIIQDRVTQLQASAGKETKIVPISAKSGSGLSQLLRETLQMVITQRNQEVEVLDEVPVISLESDDEAWKVEKTDDGFVVTGRKIERFAVRTDFESPDGIARLRDIMRKMGIMHELERKKIDPGESIIIGADPELGRFEY